MHHGGVARRPLGDVDARTEAGRAGVGRVGRHRHAAQAAKRRARGGRGLRLGREEQHVAGQGVRRRHCDRWRWLRRDGEQMGGGKCLYSYG